ncbi:aryl-sulfate sulfotransferase [Seonamhaeicola sp. MEBiC1930]|uniref:aryl-sulfate sulfotransferase n=1 Tax=Seonamhaeicola sp. MEBiC01930 TaxID=2976768 RepID=UPI003250AFA5
MTSLKNTIFAIVFLGVFSCEKVEEIQVETIPKQEIFPEIVIPETNTLGVLKKTDGAYEGFTLFPSNKNVFLINNCGEVINHWVSDFDRGGGVYLLEDGSILRAGKIENENISIGGIGGIIEHFDWYGNLVWSYKYSDENVSQHHDLYPLPNGNILLLVAEKKSKTEAIHKGRNPVLLEDDEIYTEQVIEVKPVGFDNAEIVWKWDIWDHLIQDFDNTKSNFGVVKNNPQLLNVNYVTVEGVGKKDWLHFNAMQYNKELNQILLSSQALSEIYIIDHSTTIQEAKSHSGGLAGKGGDILYRWGNPRVYGTDENQILFGQHYPNWMPYGENKGKIIMFNNGLGRDQNFSSVDIINPPISISNTYKMPNINESFLPRNTEWTYTDPTDNLNFYSRIISSAEQLPNGNILICEGTKGHLFEINENKEIVWSYINPDSANGVLQQGENPTSNSIFRAKKYSVNYLAFKDKDITPKTPIELNYNLGNCN